MWVRIPPLSAFRVAAASRKNVMALVFAAGVAIRLVPELAAYPYPIGYDVVNYYIPVVSDLGAHWLKVSGQFPLYAVLLHLAKTAAGLPAHSIVTASAVVMYGAFGLSVFLAAARVFRLGTGHAGFVALFVLLQAPALRTAWDLHRDVLALSAMMLAFYFLSSPKRSGACWKGFVQVSAFSALTAAADRMVALLFVLSVAVWWEAAGGLEKKEEAGSQYCLQ